MPDKIEFFTVDYRDKFAFIDKKKFTVGSFAVDFLNRYEENDNGARIAAMSSDNWILSSSMERGYLNDYEFVKAGEEILYILDVLPNFSPFGYLDIGSEKKTISETFTKENANFILDYYRQRAAVSLQDEGALSLDILPNGYAELSRKANEFIGTVMQILRFYENIGNDMMKAFEHLTEFVWSLDDLEHYNESELLTLADKIFDKNKFNVTTEYSAISKGDKKILLKRLHFETFYSFILTDFFEGLALGHYPRQCEICETYFLMESARKQKYCMGFAPLNLTGGEKITCRKFAAKNNQKELAKNDKITDIYNRRCSCIRAEKSQGVISEEFAESAKRLAKDLKHKFRRDDNYTAEDFERDMEKHNLYKAVEDDVIL